jgi:hypothetical protein
LVTFSGEAEKVTARRAGALQREAAKLRRNFKHSTCATGLRLHPSKSKTEWRSKPRAIGTVAPTVFPAKNPPADGGQQIAAPAPDKKSANTVQKGEA